jgi:hypothetical protein
MRGAVLRYRVQRDAFCLGTGDLNEKSKKQKKKGVAGCSSERRAAARDRQKAAIMSIQVDRRGDATKTEAAWLGAKSANAETSQALRMTMRGA